MRIPISWQAPSRGSFDVGKARTLIELQRAHNTREPALHLLGRASRLHAHALGLVISRGKAFSEKHTINR